MFALVAIPSLAVGGVHTPVIVGTSIACAGALLWALRAGYFQAPLAGLLITALGLLALAQTVPLPAGLTSALSPTGAGVWQAASELSLGREASWIPLSIDPGASLLEAAKWLSAAVVFGLSAHVGRTRELTGIARLVAGAAALVALVTLLHGVVGAESLFGVYEPARNPARWATAPLLNPNNLAGYLNLGVFAALALLLSTKRSDERTLSAICTALLVAQVILTGSRGGVVALAFGALVVTSFVFARGARQIDQRARALLLVGLAAGLGLGIYSATTGVWAELTTEGTEKLTGFVDMLAVIADYPLTGTGAGAFEPAFGPHQPVASGALYSHPENFLLAWFTDYGLPLGGVTLLAALWALRPRELGAHKSLRARVLGTGVVVFLLQNLGDLALSTLGPLLLLSIVLGGLVGAAQGANTGAPAPLHQVYAARTLAMGLLLLLAALALTRPTSAYDARLAARRAVGAARLGDPSARKQLLGQLHQSVLEHPGDPYLPLLVAHVEAAAPSGAPFRWIGLALRRNPHAARAYLLLADVLSTRGATSQAMSAARHATITDANVAHETAVRLVRDRRPADDWLQLVPEGELGGLVLGQIAVRLAPGSADRAHLLDTASALAPRDLATLLMTANELMGRVEAAQAPCTPPGACIERVKSLLAQAKRLAPSDGRLVLLGARRLAAAGKPKEGAELLAAQCSHVEAPCQRTRVQLAGTYGLPLEEPGEALTAAVCHESEPCAEAHRWLAGLHQARREPGSALAHLEAAAAATHLARDWLAAAALAQTLGEKSRAERSLRQVLLEADANDEARREATAQLATLRPGASLPTASSPAASSPTAE